MTLAAQRLGILAVIVMPQTTPPIKIDAVRQLGAEAVLESDGYAFAEETDNPASSLFLR